MKDIKCLAVFVMAMMLGAVNALAQTTISKVLIRDCSKAADTSTVVTNGATVNLASLPTNWTLDFVLTKTADVVFTTDGGMEYEFQSAPFCPMGHNTALKFAAGTHKITVQINSGAKTSFTINVGSPSAVAATEEPCVFGSNGEGVSYPSGDPSVHPQLLAACKAYDFQYLRLWGEGDFSTPFASSYWKIPLKYQNAGIKVLVVLNFEKSPKNAAPSDKDWLTKINSFPVAKSAGVWGVCIGNEVDLTSYYTGTVSQLSHLMQLAYPILHAKGYVVIAPSVIKSLGIAQQLNGSGALKYSDYIDYHIYESTAAAVLTKVDSFKAYANSIGKPSLISEIGIRGLSSNTSSWGNRPNCFLPACKIDRASTCNFRFFGSAVRLIHFASRHR